MVNEQKYAQLFLLSIFYKQKSGIYMNERSIKFKKMNENLRT